MDKAHLTADALCDLAEGLMPPADRREAESHLAFCADCRREAAAMQAYFREMSGLGTLKAPDRFLTQVHGRIATASPWRRLLAALSSPRLLPVPLMGLAVVLVGVYFVFLSPRLAEEALTEPVAASAPPPPEPTAGLAKNREADAPRSRGPSTQAGSPAGPAQSPPPAAAPAKPASEAKERVAALPRSKSGGSGRFEAEGDRKAALPETTNPAAAPQAPTETGALALSSSRDPVPKAVTPGREKAEAGPDELHARYLSDQSLPLDAVEEQIAKGPITDRLREAPELGHPRPAPSKAKATAPPAADKPSESIAMTSDGDDDVPSPASDAAESFSAPPAAYGKRGAPAAARPPATTPKPWAPLGYTLKAGTSDEALRGGLAKLGVKVLRREDRSGRNYELEVPGTRVSDLEAYLGGLGGLTPSPHPLPGIPGRKAGAPIRLTLRIVAP